ncbi:MAG: hypothetical protein FWD45_05590 [Coriobacteriia bacterium]|nr:hypothetical protein [Coriobacteriia bacterium]
MQNRNSGSVEQKSNGENSAHFAKSISSLHVLFMGRRPQAVTVDGFSHAFRMRRRTRAVFWGLHQIGKLSPACVTSGSSTSILHSAAAAMISILVGFAFLTRGVWANTTAENATFSDQDCLQIISHTVIYDANRTQPDISEVFVDEDGNEYRLVEITAAEPAAGAVYSRYYSAEIERPVMINDAAPDQAVFWQAFEASLPINDGTFHGSIALLNVVAEPILVSIERTVERRLTIEGLPDADISQIPLYYTFTVSSDEYPGATCEKELARLAVTTAISSYDADGRPASYRAEVTFRGIESCLVVDHYQARAQYGGDIASSQRMVSVQAVYQLVPKAVVAVEPVASTLIPEPVAEPLTPVDEPLINKSNTSWVFQIVTAVIMVVLLPLLYYWYRADAYLVTIEQDGSIRQLLSRRLKMLYEPSGRSEPYMSDAKLQSRAPEQTHDDAGQSQLRIAAFIVPDGFRFNQNDTDCRLQLRGRRYQKADFVEIRYRGQMLFRARPVSSFDVGKVLVAAAIDALLESEVEDAVILHASRKLSTEPKLKS